MIESLKTAMTYATYVAVVPLLLATITSITTADCDLDPRFIDFSGGSISGTQPYKYYKLGTKRQVCALDCLGSQTCRQAEWRCNSTFCTCELGSGIAYVNVADAATSSFYYKSTVLAKAIPMTDTPISIAFGPMEEYQSFIIKFRLASVQTLFRFRTADNQVPAQVEISIESQRAYANSYIDNTAGQLYPMAMNMNEGQALDMYFEQLRKDGGVKYYYMALNYSKTANIPVTSVPVTEIEYLNISSVGTGGYLEIFTQTEAPST